MTNLKSPEKEMEKKIVSYEKKVSWHLLLVFIVSGVLAYQVIFNVIFADILYNPALGDIAVKNVPVQTSDTDSELSVISWKEGGNGALRTIEEIPSVWGIQAPLFYFVLFMTALGLVLFNIRSYLLKKYIRILECELRMSN